FRRPRPGRNDRPPGCPRSHRGPDPLAEPRPAVASAAGARPEGVHRPDLWRELRQTETGTTEDGRQPAAPRSRENTQTSRRIDPSGAGNAVSYHLDKPGGSPGRGTAQRPARPGATNHARESTRLHAHAGADGSVAQAVPGNP